MITPSPAILQAIKHARDQRSLERLQHGVRFVQREGNPKRSFAVTMDHLGKLQPIARTHLIDLQRLWHVLARQLAGSPTVRNALGERTMVIGLSESGIIPSFTMHRALQTMGFGSAWSLTSRNAPGPHRFEEPHSHAPVHYLPREFGVDCGGTVWIVEDEITTGITLLNLIRLLHAEFDFDCIRVFCLLDARSPECRKRFKEQVALLGRCIETHPLLEWKGDRLPHPLPRLDHPETRRSDPSGCPTPRLCHGETIARQLHDLDRGEVDRLQQITRSPWRVDGVHVLSRREISPGYYLYNHA